VPCSNEHNIQPRRAEHGSTTFLLLFLYFDIYDGLLHDSQL